MKQKGFMKKLSAVLLAATMTVSTFPQLSTPVFAADTANELPDSTQFATVEQLKSFNTDDTNDGTKNPAKVYFGNNNQQWWIAGSQQEHGLTLFAASPLATGLQFEPDAWNDKQYSDDWNCDYVSIGGSNPTEVYPNHYGASPLRTTLKTLETSYFTVIEQGLMNDTTIHTNDTRNSSVYSTTNKLYLAYGDYNDDKYITVGTNSQDSLNDGLRIDMSYWGNSSLWLRAPFMYPSYYALVASPGAVGGTRVNSDRALVPAFELNLSSVIFASAAQAASSKGTLASNDAFTLRYKSENLGSALVSYDKSKVTLTDVPSGTYLVVQNSVGTQAKQITNETEVSAQTDFGLDSFANCKVWLETTDTTNRITYATLATEQTEEPIAEVNGKQYTSLENAFNDANDGNTVILLKDIEFNDHLSISKNINLDLNGKTLNINSGNININSNIKFNIINEEKGDITNSVAVGYGIVNQGALVVNGSISCDIYNQSSSSKIENGTYSGTISNEGIINDGIYLGVVVLEDSGVIKDGSFGENSIVDGYGTIDGGEYRGNNRFFGPVNGGDFYSSITLWGSEYNSFCKGVVNGGNFAQEPILEYGAKYGEGLVLTRTNNEKLPYKVVKKEDAITLNITLGNNLTLESGKLEQAVEKDVTIDPITIKVNEGYYLPDDYISNLQGQLNGLKVTETDKGFTISGTPTSDVNITLLAATVLPKSDTPIVELKTTSTSITATVTNHKIEFGNIEYKWDNGSWQQDNNTLSNLTPNTKYQLAVRFTGNGFYQPSDEFNIEITTLKDGNTVIVVPTDLTTTYKEGLTLSDVDLSGTGWTWVDGNTSLSAGTKSYPATFDTTDLESTTDFNGVQGYDEKTHKVTRDVQVEVKKADSAVTITTKSLDKAYDGNAVTDPEYTTSRSDGKVTIKWQENTGSVDTPKWEDLKSAPSTVGTYRVVVELAGNDNYNSASATLEFVISKADNAWTEELSIKDWTYNEKENVPSAKAQFGDVTFTYSSEENGTYTNEVPKNAGTYYVKATVAGTENYTGLESVVSFEIAKADTTLTFEKENIDKTYDKNAISEPMVTKNGSGNDIVFEWYIDDGNGWQKLDNAPSDVGTYKVVAIVTEDTNYNGASIEKEFSISTADNKWTKELSIKDWTYGEAASAPSAKVKYGDVVYTYSNSKDGTYTSDVPVNAGTWYVKASVAGTANYTGLESAPVSFEIKKADSTIKFKDGISFDKVYDENAVAVTEEQIEKTGSTGTVSFIFEKKVNDEWKAVEAATEVGTYRVTATLAEDNNHTSATSKPLEFTISKADSAITITTQSLDKVYDRNAVTDPEYTTSRSDGKVTIKWQENTGSVDTPKWEDLKSAPSSTGNYQVVVELAENDNYNSASATLDFVISKADNAWTEELSIKGWTYNEKANVPTAKAQYGDVVFTYSSEENGTYTNEVPKNAGTWYVKATVAGTENYTGLESVVSFEIAKAIPTYEKVTGLVLGQGQALSKIELPEQFKWVDETMTADELGTHTFKAVYTPEDTANYQTIEVEIGVEVVPTPVAVNHVPTISASDKTITVGDKFDSLKDVTAIDKEDGDLTSKIEIISNTVDTKKAGTYEVTYQVTDSQGATVTKTIKVTVKAVPIDPDTDKPNTDKPNTDKPSNDKGSVETGDRNNLLLREILLSGSGVVLLYSLYRKKRKHNNKY